MISPKTTLSKSVYSVSPSLEKGQNVKVVVGILKFRQLANHQAQTMPCDGGGLGQIATNAKMTSACANINLFVDLQKPIDIEFDIIVVFVIPVTVIPATVTEPIWTSSSSVYRVNPSL